MPESRGARLAARLVPSRVRDEVFLPALRDLQVERLRRLAGARGRIARMSARITYAAGLAAIVGQSWRVALADGRAPRFDPIIPAVIDPRPSHGDRIMQALYHLRHAVRLLGRQPLFTAAATLTLALGVGANVAVFAVVEAVLLRPLPYPEAERLFILHHRDDRTRIEKEFIAIGDFVDLQARQQSFASLSAFSGGQATITVDGEAQRVDSLAAGPGLLETLGAAPFRGRLLTEADSRPGAPPVVVVGHALWSTTFHGDEGVIGRRVRVGTTDREIVGIAAPGLRFPPARPRDVALVVPMSIPAAAPAERKSGWVFAVARPAAGVTLERAAAELTALSERMEAEFPAQNQGSRYFVRSLRDTMVGGAKQPIVLLFGAVGVVLLIACANVGNLLLARALGRRQEMSVRMALGAGRGRLLAQTVAESVVLAVAAGLVGIAVAYWGTPALIALAPPSVSAPGLTEAGINGGVLAFTLALIVLATLIFSATTVIGVRAGGGDPLASSERVAGGRIARRAAAGLVVAEVALAVVLLFAAGLILRSFGQLLRVDPGFDPSGVVAMDITLPAGRYAAAEARAAVYDRALAGLAAMPGVTAAGAAGVTPHTRKNRAVPFERSDRRVPAGQRPPDVGWQSASGGFFEALQIPLRSGRLFTAADRQPAPPVVIVSESIERQYFAGESAVGRRVRIGDGEAEIVGVVGDIRRASLTTEPRPDMYFPFERQPGGAITLFVRTSGDPASLTPAIREALRRQEPQIVFGTTTTLDDVLSDSIASTTFALWLLGLFAGIALALAGVGVYAVMSYVVRQRTREIGTRMALGASSRDIAWLVVRQGGAMAAAGLAIGLGIAWVAARSLSAMLYDVSASDPGTLAVAVIVIAGASLVASYLPARRAARVDAAAVCKGVGM
jgi:predicted permease